MTDAAGRRRSGEPRMCVRTFPGVPDDLLWVVEHREHRRSLLAFGPWVASRRVAALMTAGLVTIAINSLGAAAPLRVDVTVAPTGWLLVGGQRTGTGAVPSLAFTVTNTADRPLRRIQVNAVFETVDATPGQLGTAFSWLVDAEGVAPGGTSRPVFLRPRDWMAAAPAASRWAPEFPGARVRLFIKHAGTWTLIATFPLANTRMDPAALTPATTGA